MAVPGQTEAHFLCTHTLSAFMLNHTCSAVCHPSSWLQPYFVRIHSHSPLQSDIKPDDLLLKGSKTKEKSKEKKGSKDKKKGQAADGSEKRPLKARVDELLVCRLHSGKTEPAHSDTRADTNVWRVCWYAGVQQGAGEWVWQLWGLAPHFQLVQRKGRGWRRTCSGWRQDCWQIQGGKTLEYKQALPKLRYLTETRKSKNTY